MPKTRQPREVWRITRKRIYIRDRGQCFRCCQLAIAHVLKLESCHIDHIESGKRAGNADSNLRVLCPMHHTLRDDQRHRGMIGSALRTGLIRVNWREHLW